MKGSGAGEKIFWNKQNKGEMFEQCYATQTDFFYIQILLEQKKNNQKFVVFSLPQNFLPWSLFEILIRFFKREKLHAAYILQFRLDR